MRRITRVFQAIVVQVTNEYLGGPLMKSMTVAVCLCLLVFGINRSMQAQGRVVRSSISAESSNREQDGLNGPVRRLRVETAEILVKDGKTVEAPHVLREISTYDPKGRRIDSVAYSVEGTTLPGKEQYQYDEKGNIVEMVLRADDGSILSKEKYDYEFDEFGNWKKMTSSVGVYESGKVSYEPVELTYRMISYYYNEAIDKVAKSLSKSNDSSGSASRAERRALSRAVSAGANCFWAARICARSRYISGSRSGRECRWANCRA